MQNQYPTGSGASWTPTPQTTSTSHSSHRSTSIVPYSRKKSLWKMVRSMLFPRRILNTFIACGGTRARRRSRLERMQRGQLPLNRPATYVTPMIPTPMNTIPTPTPMPDAQDTAQIHTIHTVQVEVTTQDIQTPTDLSDLNDLQNLTISAPNVDQISSQDIENIQTEEGQGQRSPDIEEGQEIIVRMRSKKVATNSSTDLNSFHGWRKSSIDVTSEPPLTLKWIPSGLQIGDRVMWINEEEEQPERAVVRWIGKIRDQFYAGVEFERSIGNSSGLYGYSGGLCVRLFTCDLGFGRFVPISELVLYSDFHDKGVKAGFICVICRDDFLELPDSQGDEGHMVATKCGHLYHETCLEQWLAVALAKAKNKGNGSHPCPHCQEGIKLDEVIRLFPAQV